MELIYKGNTITLSGGTISFNGEPVKVNDSRTHTYKLNKTCISAEGGAAGLMSFLTECISDNFGLVWVNAVTEHMETLTSK